MRYLAFSVYDSKVGLYLPLMFMRSKGEVLRSFESTVNDSSTLIGKYPADYSLFETGTWDDETCEYVAHLAPISLGVALEFLNNQLHAVQADMKSTKKD